MKANFKVSLLAIAGLVFLSGLSVLAQPDDSPKADKKKHLKMVKIEDGVKTELDTVISGDSDFEWFSDDDFAGNIDSMVQSKMKEYEIQVTDDGDGHRKRIMIMSPGEKDMMMHEFMMPDKDSMRYVMKIRHDDRMKDMEMLFDGKHAPMPPHAPMAPSPKFLFKGGGNVIDLNDPDIISFQKKDLSDGREKIEIIRKKPAAKDVFFRRDEMIEKPKK